MLYTGIRGDDRRRKSALVREIERFRLACVSELKLSSLKLARKDYDEISNLGISLVVADWSR
jgi:hypothetical protein